MKPEPAVTAEQPTLAPLPRVAYIFPLVAFGLCVLTIAASAALDAFDVSPDAPVALVSRIARMIAMTLLPISLPPLLLRGWLLFHAAANPLVRNPTAYSDLGARARGLYATVARNERRIAIALCAVFALMSIVPAVLSRDFILEPPSSTPKTNVPAGSMAKTIAPAAAVDECVKRTAVGKVMREAAEAWCNCAVHMTKVHECDAESKGVLP